MATKDITVRIEDLKPAAKRVAARAIEDVHLAYYEKDGIRDTAAKLEGQVDSAAKHVYSLAQFASKAHPGNLETAAALFGTMCLYAENEYKREHEVENLREALPTWATFKSNVLRGLRLGLDPREFKTEKIFRSRTMEAISRTRGEPEQLSDLRDDSARDGPPKQLDEAEIEDFVATTTVPETLRQLLSQVVYAVEVVKPARIRQAEEILRETWQKLGALTDKRRIA
jgi:hypothetical protein